MNSSDDVIVDSNLEWMNMLVAYTAVVEEACYAFQPGIVVEMRVMVCPLVSKVRFVEIDFDYNLFVIALNSNFAEVELVAVMGRMNNMFFHQLRLLQ